MLMATREMMLWNIVVDLSAAGKNMKSASKNGTMIVMNFCGHPEFNSSLSCMMSQPSIRTISANQLGSTAPIRQHYNPKTMDNQ